MSNEAELSRSSICEDGVTVQEGVKRKFTIVCSDVLHKTFNVAIPRCCFAEDGKENYVPKSIMHVQSHCFANQFSYCFVTFLLAVVVVFA